MSIRSFAATGLCALLWLAQALPAQEHPHSMPDMPGMGDKPMDNMDMSGMNKAGMFLMEESSGTAFQPSAWPMPMWMSTIGDWHLMWMGQAFVVDTQQSGPRGHDKLYSTNWGMVSAIHRLGSGSFLLRGMLSLEPATITDRRYPLLFQTGETAYENPLVDAQHPHDLFMELGAQYAHSIGEKGTWNVYYAPVGEPALGPVAYPHRASAMELPEAALGHHWQDSSHIANNVLTAGVSYGKIRVEGSGFYGREPDENRWNIDHGPMDSWSTRVAISPGKNWTGQVSVGYLTHPEAAHPGDVVRTTASIEYVRPNGWASSLIWGQDNKRAESSTVNSVLAETVVPFRRLNFLTGRFEWSQRDELFPPSSQVFDIAAYTVGYTRDFPLFARVQTGLGANVSAYGVPSVIQSAYGTHPWGVNVFLRVRLRKEQHGS